MVTTLNIAGAAAGVANRSWALSMPIVTAANETSGRQGSITRVSAIVVSSFPGPNPGASARTKGAAKTNARTTTAPRMTASRVSRRDESCWARAAPPSASSRV
jgi:hypothetical protein